MFKGLLLLHLMLVFFVGCSGNSKDGLLGDLFSKQEKEEDVSGNFNSSCQIDTKSLALLLKEDIRDEITCLESKLNLFIDIVATEKPGYLSYNKLTEFIRKNYDDVDDGTINALGGVFDLSTLLLGDEPGYIKQSNVTPLTTILIELNRIFVEGNVYQLFTSEEVVNFNEHNERKTQIYSSFKELGIFFRQHFVDNNKSVNLATFINRFKGIGSDDVIENAHCLLFLKKAILGGDTDVLTAQELKRAAKLFPEFSKVIFDFVKMPDAGENAYLDEQILKIFRENVLTAKRYFYYADKPDEVVFTYKDIEKVVHKFFPEVAYYFKYKESILRGKKVLFKSDSEDFTAEEINILLDDILFKNFDRGVFFYKFFEENRTALLMNAPIEKGFQLGSYIDFAKETQYLNQFNRIVKNYQFYIGDQYMPQFNYDYNRNARGIFEVSIFEDVVRRFFMVLGSKNESALFNYSMTLEELQETMIRFSELFEGEGWITKGRTASTAETITLMTSLFFRQSDGDEFIEVPEFTEFIISMLSALKLSNNMFDELSHYCEISKHGTFSGQCFRNNFKKILLIEKDGKPLGNYMPELTRYIDRLSESKLNKYLKRTATFSRTCPYFNNGEERPMTKGDGLVTLAGLLAVEQSVLRFDSVRPKPTDEDYEEMDGVLTPEELDDAYSVYGPAVSALAPDFMGPKAVKRLYQYILKHQKVPADLETLPTWKEKLKAGKDGLHLLSFIYAPWPIMTDAKRRSNANRMTFAAVLEIIAENSPATKAMYAEDPMFCEKMRLDEN